jgi:hypothetical protein
VVVSMPECIRACVRVRLLGTDKCLLITATVPAYASGS